MSLLILLLLGLIKTNITIIKNVFEIDIIILIYINYVKIIFTLLIKIVIIYIKFIAENI